MDFTQDPASMFIAFRYLPTRWRQWYRRAKAINGTSVYAFVVSMVLLMYQSVAFLGVMLIVKVLFLVNDYIMYVWTCLLFTNVITLVITYLYAELLGYHEMAWSLPLLVEEQRAKTYQECDPAITARDVMEHNWCIFEWYLKHKFPDHNVNTGGVVLLYGTPDEIYKLPFKEWIEEMRRIRPDFDAVDQCERTLCSIHQKAASVG